ncbi:MAG TPA: hypothetical protein VHC21_04470 [Candidatus Saccharimonadales bacterium]|nr:hypothetical protein [Candidatus Saccharimonadales bacterium]
MGPQEKVQFLNSLHVGWELGATALLVIGFIWLMRHESRRKKLPKE